MLGMDSTPVSESPSPAGEAREAGLTSAVADRRILRLEAQRAGTPHEPFIPFAEIRFEEEIQIDQEALHFDPFEGRGFEPYGFVTTIRRSVYPASVRARGATNAERQAREAEGLAPRLARYLALDSAIPFNGGTAMSTEKHGHPLLKAAGVCASGFSFPRRGRARMRLFDSTATGLSSTKTIAITSCTAPYWEVRVTSWVFPIGSGLRCPKCSLRISPITGPAGAINPSG